ncbi:MAG TPA: sulfatase [Edaphobacter sp.]
MSDAKDQNQPQAPATTSRRDFLTKASGAALATTLPAAAQSAPQKAPATHSRKRPLNVLFFMSDDMRPELACYGSRFHAHSPNIDKLASDGVRFDRNYCQFPLCNPSRSSMFTGHPPLTTKVLGNTTNVRNLHPDWVTLPQLFRENGYTTLRTGKLFHAGLDDHKAWTDFDGDTESLHPTQDGVRLNIPREQIPQANGVLPVLPGDNQRAAHSDQLLVLQGNGEGAGDYIVADRTIENLRANKDKPFFIGCGFSKPHSPPEAPQRFYDLYDPKQIQLPPDFAAWPTVPPGFPRAAIRMRNADLFIGRGASETEAREVIRAYLASISWVDYNLGRVLSELDSLGLRQNTVVVFVADHGYQPGEKGKWSKAGSLFENGTRVPLIIHAPGARGNGRTSLRISQSLDVYRTIAELANLEVPQEIEGTSLVPLLHNPQAKWDHPAYSIWSEDGSTVHGTMVRTEQWRYAEFGKDAANGAMLFDVHADPLELTNLADRSEHSEVRSRLSKLIAAYSYPV